jgi:uncharacterized membrane protein
MSTEGLLMLCGVGSGMMAGFFLAFSACVMKALGRIPPAGGIAAMQSINEVVINPLFLTAFLGTGAACLLEIVGSLWWWQVPAPGLVRAACMVYLVGTVLVTIAFNVPRNNDLAKLAPADPEAARHWMVYRVSWTAWNHVRTTAALLAAVLFGLALGMGA